MNNPIISLIEQHITSVVTKIIWAYVYEPLGIDLEHKTIIPVYFGGNKVYDYDNNAIVGNMNNIIMLLQNDTYTSIDIKTVYPAYNNNIINYRFTGSTLHIAIHNRKKVLDYCYDLMTHSFKPQHEHFDSEHLNSVRNNITNLVRNNVTNYIDTTVKSKLQYHYHADNAYYVLGKDNKISIYDNNHIFKKKITFPETKRCVNFSVTNDLIFCIIHDTNKTTHTITILDKVTVWIKNHIHTPYKILNSNVTISYVYLFTTDGIIICPRTYLNMKYN